MAPLEINSVGSYLDTIDSMNQAHVKYFFRGQGDIEWQIESSIARRNRSIEADYLKLAEHRGIERTNADFVKLDFTRKIHRQFVASYPTFPEVHLLKGYNLNDIDMMMVSQHYGLPTRLIDWSLNPLIALYFATEESLDKDACVFMLSDSSPHSEHLSFSNSQTLLNTIERERQFAKKLIKMREAIFAAPVPVQNIDLSAPDTRETVFLPCMSLFKDLNSSNIELVYPHLLAKLGPNKPIQVANWLQKIVSNDDIPNALQDNSSIKIQSKGHFLIKPLPLNQRIKNQQGVFQFSQSPFGRDSLNDEIRDFGDCENTDRHLNLIRIKIPAVHKAKINTELARYGISRDFVYPEIDNFTKEMTQNTANELLHMLLPPNT
ncbi:FRG domain-containing protein [Pectobacterium versatile]|uniref:FRG domain-containing protein n=1 Tax=Pectobacterium versatile TaxID=2488639 RepID=UPI0030158DD4